MLKKYYLGGFFWAPIPVKWYQNNSGFAGGLGNQKPNKNKPWPIIIKFSRYKY